MFELKIADYVPEAAEHPAWRMVRFEDAIDMATGIGNGSTKREPNNISDGYLDPTYSEWYEARSEGAKVAALLKNGRTYPWGPGKVARYRDEDMFVLGVAMDNFLKSKEGPSADIWSMLETEVFVPIGIHYPAAIPEQKALSGVLFEAPGGWGNARRLCASEVSLPIHPYLHDDEVAEVIAAVNRF